MGRAENRGEIRGKKVLSHSGNRGAFYKSAGLSSCVATQQRLRDGKQLRRLREEIKREEKQKTRKGKKREENVRKEYSFVSVSYLIRILKRQGSKN